MIYLKNPLCLGMEESEYKEMLALGGMRQKHFEKNEVILSAGCTTHEIGLVLSGSVNIENLDLWGSKSILSNIGAGQVYTPGDRCHVLVAMNPSALKTQIKFCKPQGLITVSYTHLTLPTTSRV